MTDRTLNEISSATDFANAYTEDASGNQVKISKADMASVLAEQMTPIKVTQLKQNISYDLNNLEFGLYYAFDSHTVKNVVNTPLDNNHGDLVVLSIIKKFDGVNAVGFQICFQENSSSNGIYIRMARYYQSGFSSWVKIA